MFIPTNCAQATPGLRVLPTTGAKIPCFLNGRFLTHCGPLRPGHQFSGGTIGMRIGGKFETPIPGRLETPFGGKFGANMHFLLTSSKNIRHMSNDLPVELQYLMPVLVDMSALADEIDDSYDTTVLMRALSERIQGLSKREARKRINADHKALVEWLQVNSEHPAWFIASFISPKETVDNVMDWAAPPSARHSGRVGAPLPSVTVPPGFKLKKERACLLLSTRTCSIVVSPMSLEVLESVKEVNIADRNAVLTPFAIGKVSGTHYRFENVTNYYFTVGSYGMIVAVAGYGAIPDSVIGSILESIQFD